MYVYRTLRTYIHAYIHKKKHRHRHVCRCVCVCAYVYMYTQHKRTHALGWLAFIFIVFFVFGLGYESRIVSEKPSYGIRTSI